MNLHIPTLRTLLRQRLAARPSSVWQSFRRALAIVLIATVGPVAPLLAQAAGAAPHMLFITILDGEDSINNIRERTAREPIVQVEDENHKPVAGALLLFTIQGGPNGAGASFNGLNTLSVTTDAEGKATAHGLKPNETQGSYSIAVSASLGALIATAIIRQSNAAGGGTSANPSSTSPATSNPPSTPTSTSTSATSSTSTSSATSTRTESTTRTGLRHSGKLHGVFTNPWVFASLGAVVVTIAVRTAIVNGHGPTSITPGNGNVGAP